MKTIEKQKALVLRREGRSIKEIARIVGVSKASISVWVRDIVLNKKQLSVLKAKGFSSEVIEKRRHKRLENEQVKREAIATLAQKDIKNISTRDLRIIGLCLYWGEGGKIHQGSARISNSDPAVIKVMMRFFREICLVEEKKFRGHIHVHSHLGTLEAEKYWSGISGIPRTQFFKAYTKPSIASKNKKDSLPYGTFDIYVCSTKLFLQIIAQIEKIKKLAV
ncbi:MAG: helix-turn-helix domain-containing protein [Patescibacteria group bacterium]